jgi:ATP-dependent protease ClpP protease subunit
MSCALAGDTPQTDVTVAEYLNKDGTTTFNVRFHGPFDANSEQVVVSTLERAAQGDRINVDFNSPGGSLQSLKAILDAMESTKGTVSCHVSEWAASAAAIMAWNCPTLTADRGAMVLYHKVATSPLAFIMMPRITSNAIDEVSRKLKNIDAIILTIYLQDAMRIDELREYNAGLDITIPARDVATRHAIKHGYAIEKDPQEEIDKATRPERHDRIPHRR